MEEQLCWCLSCFQLKVEWIEVEEYWRGDRPLVRSRGGKKAREEQKYESMGGQVIVFLILS